MVDLQLKVNDAVLQQAVAGLGERITDWRDAWPQVAEAMRNIVREQFASEGGRGAEGGWAPLSAAYAARKAKLYPGQPLLRATDRLYESLTGDSPEAVLEATAESLVVGSSVPYAVFVQGGAQGVENLRFQIRDSRAGGRPERVIYDLVESDALAVAEPLHAAAKAAVGKLGFET